MTYFNHAKHTLSQTLAKDDEVHLMTQQQAGLY